MSERLVAGLDLGGTKISAAIVDAEGVLLHRLKRPIVRTGFRESVLQIGSIFRELEAASAVTASQIAGIGVCIPGIYSASTGNAWAPNLWGWDQVPLQKALEDTLPARVTIDSDRAACVVGEQWLGAAHGLSDVVFLAIGTGIGAGILTGGRLCRGTGDIAGAVGWFALDPCKKESYKRTGCFEAEAAGPAVARRAGAADTRTVVEAARRGDAAALAVLEQTACWIGMGVANLISLLNPEMIILGGGFMQAGDLLLASVRREALEWAQPIAATQVRIELSKLGEDAGLLGAARLALLATNP